MIEAVIDQDEPEFVVLRSPQLETAIYIGHGISGFEGQQVSFAVRPESSASARTSRRRRTTRPAG